MKNTLRLKMTLLLVGSILAIVGIAMIVSTFAMRRYTTLNLSHRMTTTYEAIDTYFGTLSRDSSGRINEGTKDIVEGFSDLILASDFDVVVLDENSLNGISVYSNINSEGNYRSNLMMLLDLLRAPEYSESGTTRIETEQAKFFFIQKTHDAKNDTDYYDLVGRLTTGEMIAIRSSLKSIDASVAIAVRIFGLVSLFISIFGGLAMFIVANRYTKPVHQMAEAANRMASLNFDTKIAVRGNDEIAELGKSINEMSSQLETTISELKQANNELRRDNEEKTQIDEMRKEFLSHVSHELKTPIAVIQGYAEGLQDNIMDEDEEMRRFYCEVIIDEANKMNQMVKKLLTLNEIEFGNYSVSFERFNLTELIRNIIKSSEILIEEEKQTKIILDYPHDVYVWADEFMIEEVLTNYITNAIHHVSENGEIRIGMAFHENHVQVQVYNDGNLIPDEERNKVFIKFYKIDKARTREYGGSGIGLSIVAAIMNAHGQKYGVINEEKGVRFFFELDMK